MLLSLEVNLEIYQYKYCNQDNKDKDNNLKASLYDFGDYLHHIQNFITGK